MAGNTDKLKAVFLAALDVRGGERAAFLAEACGADADLRRGVEALLRAHEHADPLLDHRAAEHLNGLADAPAGRDESFPFLAPPTRPDALGRLGHYEVLELLGRGGFGLVFRAFDEALQRVVAVKVLAPELTATSPARKRFLREARSSARVRHENVIRVYAVEEHPLPYLVMEFIPGETLQQRLDRTGPLDPAEAVGIGRQIAEGLAAAHATGLVHRDIKPANILIESGPHRHVTITDFGLARAADDASVSQSGVVAGTPMFMAPEQARGEPVDHRSDLFSLGSVLYAMCSGRPPFRAPSTFAVLKRVVEDTPRPIPEVVPEVPRWLCDAIARLHAKRPDDRFASAREVAELLARHPDPLPDAATVEAAPAGAPTAATSGGRRLRTGRWATAAAALLALLGGLGFAEATGATDVRGTVVRLFSPEGTLVVEVDDPNVSVVVDGSDLVITGAGAKEIRLKPGRYAVEARKDGQVVRRELVSVTTNGRQVVRVSQEAAPPAARPAARPNPDRRAAEYALSVGGTVQVNGVGKDITAVADLPAGPFRLTCARWFQNERVTDAGLASFEGCEHLTHLELWEAFGVHDAGLAYFQDCKKLTHLSLTNLPVTDAGLVHFRGCAGLTALSLNSTPVGDAGLANFKDCKSLTRVSLRGTLVTDAGVALLKGCKDLTSLDLEFASRISDAALDAVAGCTTLTELRVHHTKVSTARVRELTKALPACKIVWDGGLIDPTAAAWERSVAGRPAAEQVAEVTAKLKERNPGSRGEATHRIEAGVVTEFGVGSGVLDLSPVRALAGLTSFRCDQLGGATVLRDLSPLRGLPLTSLTLVHTSVADLAPLKGMKLTALWVGVAPVSDLSPLAGNTTLTALHLWMTKVTDLSPLKGMPLASLNVGRTGVTDLSALKGLPLTTLRLQGSPVRDLSPLAGMNLTTLDCSQTQVTDLAPLRGMPLKTLVCDFKAERDAPILRAIRTLETINGKPAAEFWKEVGATARK